MDSKYFVFASDLVSVLVGPFDSRAAAAAHIEFCEDRGDGAATRVIDAAEADRDFADLDRMTPEEDRAYINVPPITARCPRCGGGPGDPSCGKLIHAMMPDGPSTDDPEEN